MCLYFTSTYSGVAQLTGCIVSAITPTSLVLCFLLIYTDNGLSAILLISIPRNVELAMRSWSKKEMRKKGYKYTKVVVEKYNERY